MPGKQLHTYPDDDTIIALVREHGSATAVSRHLGIPRNSFQHHIEKRGLLARCAEARQEHTVANRRPIEQHPVTAEPAPVDDPQRVRIDQLSAQVATLKRENTAYAKALAKQEEFFDRIVEATRVPVEQVKLKPPRKRKPSLPHRSVVAPLYDMQFGQLVRQSDTPGGRGQFNTKIFDERLARYVDGATGNIRDYAQSHTIDELIIPFGGDHVEGDEIFRGQPWQLELDPCRQVWELTLKIHDAIERIVRFAKEEIGVPHIAMYGTGGNHGKVGGRQKGATPASYNWDILFLTILFDRLRGLPIDETAIDAAGSVFFYAAGIEFQMVHGHEIRGWGGLPLYGLQRFDARSVRLHNRLYRYLLMGHHHQPAEITTGSGAETIVSGDWCGANNMSGIITAASRPQQKLLFVANKWGITETARIYLTDAETANAPSPIYGQAR